MNRTALILAAHGCRDEPGVAAQVTEWAARIDALGLFDVASAAFNQGEPHFDSVLDTVDAERFVIVPVMTSEGYFSRVFLPERLSRNVRYGQVAIQMTPPVGTHPRVAGLIAARVEALISDQGFDSSKTAVMLIGHGTTQHAGSGDATSDVVEVLRAREICATVEAAFLDQAPEVETVCRKLRRHWLVAIPFLIGAGRHALVDLPRRLGIEGTSEMSLPILGRSGKRPVILDRPIGAAPEMVEVITDIARRYASRNSGGGKPTRVVRLGTRRSNLARWQAEHVAGRLRMLGARVDIVEIETTGDCILDLPIAELPGGAPFADELESALREGRIDLAVHSLKDLSVVEPADLSIAAVLPRGDASEALVSRDGVTLAGLPARATLGTSSPRRAAQALRLRPDLRIVGLRGPVDDRVQQVLRGDMDAAVMATAGLERLGLSEVIAERFSVERFLPAPAQAALAIQIRSDDAPLRKLVSVLNDHETWQAVQAELALLAAAQSLEAMTVAGYAVTAGMVRLHARIMALDGSAAHDAVVTGANPAQVGRDAFAELQGLHCGTKEAAA